MTSSLALIETLPQQCERALDPRPHGCDGNPKAHRGLRVAQLLVKPKKHGHPIDLGQPKHGVRDLALRLGLGEQVVRAPSLLLASQVAPLAGRSPRLCADALAVNVANHRAEPASQRACVPGRTPEGSQPRLLLEVRSIVRAPGNGGRNPPHPCPLLEEAGEVDTGRTVLRGLRHHLQNAVRAVLDSVFGIPLSLERAASSGRKVVAGLRDRAWDRPQEERDPAPPLVRHRLRSDTRCDPDLTEVPQAAGARSERHGRSDAPSGSAPGRLPHRSGARRGAGWCDKAQEKWSARSDSNRRASPSLRSGDSSRPTRVLKGGLVKPPPTPRLRCWLPPNECRLDALATDVARQSLRRSVGAPDRIRTDDIQLGKLTLYQLSYGRWGGGKLERRPGPVKPGRRPVPRSRLRRRDR